MLYQKKTFHEEDFHHPQAEYRGTPFWAWNCLMNQEEIDRSIAALEDMGMGGAHIHCRTGMANPYMGREFLNLVSYAHQQLKDRHMLTWLYDEDRWPSGAGGGFVTKDHRYRIRFLVFSPENLDNKTYDANHLTSSGQAIRSNERRLLARYAVTLENGYLASYRTLGESETVKPNEREWFAYLEVSGDNPWFNNQAYLNTLDQHAVQRFIEVTHEKYDELLGDEFGKDIPAIFTDEPQFSHKTQFKFAEDRSEVTLPFTDDLDQTFQEAYGHSLLASLPELFWELPDDRISLTRYQYHDHIAERFASAFADTVGGWCKEHGIMLTGHMMEEPTLQSQTAALGEAMRSYRSFALPGIDMLCDRRELTTAKQAQSAAHQFGCPGVLSELYGVTNWDFDFKGHKLQGDWQAALGVTVRVPHLAWTSMAGEAKRDYPASISFQSPWYKNYPYIENYFARVNSVMTRGKAIVRIGVIHPIESYWLYWGTEEQTGAIRDEMDRDFKNLVDILLYGLQDFDFLCESLLPELVTEKTVHDKAFHAGEMAYDVVLVPNCITLRSTTIDRLQEFKDRGGTVIFAGKTPCLEGAVPSKRAEELASDACVIPFDRESILSHLSGYRFLDIRDEDGNRSDNLIYQLREDEDKKWLFLAHVNRMQNPDVPSAEKLTITLDGRWAVRRFDALEDQIYDLPCQNSDGKTILHQTMYEQDSLLLCLTAAADSKGMSETDRQNCENHTFARITGDDRVPVKLEEPNVFVLDQAEYAFDGGDWQPREEILRIDNAFRDVLRYPLRMEAFAQPWVESDEQTSEPHTLSLRLTIMSEAACDEVVLGMEEASDARIVWNGEETTLTDEWYVDPCIQKVRLGGLRAGANDLLINIPFHPKRNVEAMYLLGDFGVRMAGATAVVTKPVTQLAFGDIVPQGLPFYGGNLTYEMSFDVEQEKEYYLVASKFRAPLLEVSLDDQLIGPIAFSPYRVSLGKMCAGHHVLKLRMFGSRVNTFGPLHNCDETVTWYGPNAWRTTEESWAYEYQLRRVGVLKMPEIG